MDRVLNQETAAEASDRELVARCKAGDETAFDALVLRHRERAFHIAYPLLLDHEDSTEVAQDAFVKVYRTIAGFRGDSEFTTWLYQIVVNLARNKRRWWRRRGKSSTISLDCPAESPDGQMTAHVASSADPPDTEAAQAEFSEILEKKMGELPAQYREVLLLRNVRQMSYEEIARMLHCNVGTVKSRIARGREALREAMAGELE
jgi:RNA polymerase sigma-70 factor (ECF subfamily)